MKKGSFDLYTEITNRIIHAIESNPGNFVMPWNSAAATLLPQNGVTGKRYRGINIISLWISAHMNSYGAARWATYKQWAEIGAQVRKGEKGTPIVFYKTLEFESAPDANGATEEYKIPFARASWVFNADQVDDAPAVEIECDAPQFDLIEQAENKIRATGAVIQRGGDLAFYHPKADYIQIPHASAFTGSPTRSAQESYYSTIFHELAHWTGAPHRLNREKGKRFADRPYCFEEIIAEMSAAFSCASLGISSEPREDHAQYIAQYLELMKSDNRAIFQAATAAAAATDYVLRENVTDIEGA